MSFSAEGRPYSHRATFNEETLNRIRRRFFLSPDAEISMEANPGTLTKEALQIYKRAGVNRLSIGLQSAHNKELSMLGQIHTWEEFKESFSLARRAGFENLNVDLLAALPGQTVESFSESLRAVLALSPEHLSVYSLIIEEETPFYETYGKQAEARAEGREDAAIRPLPSEEDERTMYRITEELLGNRIKSGGGFIKNQKLGVMGKSQCQVQLHPHALGQLLRCLFFRRENSSR